jgi:hypothetical protein
MIAALGCGHSGKMVVDTPIKPYQAPDISEITGIDEDDNADQGSAAAPAPAPAPASAAAPAASAPAPKK